MKYYLVKYKYTSENGEEIEKELKLRLSADSDIEIENQTGLGLVDYVNSESVEMCVTLLQHMMKYEEPNYNQSQAKKLYDVLVDNGWTKKRIIVEIIYETLVISGFFTQEELNEMMGMSNLTREKIKAKQLEALENL